MSPISGGISWSPNLSTSFFQPFIYRRHWKGMFMDEGNTFTSPDLKGSQMPIRVWHGDIESGDWLAGDGGTSPHLIIIWLWPLELSVPSTQFGLSVFIEADMRSLVRKILCWCLVSIHLFSSNLQITKFSLFFLTTELSKEILSRESFFSQEKRSAIT